jgi:hypothetical protein
MTVDDEDAQAGNAVLPPGNARRLPIACQKLLSVPDGTAAASPRR